METAALADGAGARDRAHEWYGVDRKLALLASEVGDEIGARTVVLTHIVIVDGLPKETAVGDRYVNSRGGGVGEAEEWLSVDLAQNPAVHLDARVGPDHLQVEHEPAEFD